MKYEVHCGLRVRHCALRAAVARVIDRGFAKARGLKPALWFCGWLDLGATGGGVGVFGRWPVEAWPWLVDVASSRLAIHEQGSTQKRS